MLAYKRTPAHLRRLRSRKNQAMSCLNAMIQAFDNEDYQLAYELSKESQESIALFWADFNQFRGWQENGVREEAWAR